MKKFAVKTTALLIAAGLGVGAAGSAFAAESLQDVMKRRNLTQQDLLAAAKTYTPTGGRDEFLKAAQALGLKIGADVSTDQNQLAFSAAVLKAKQSSGDVLFAYTNEEESARLLR